MRKDHQGLGWVNHHNASLMLAKTHKIELRRELTAQFLMDRNLVVSDSNIKNLKDSALYSELRIEFKMFDCDEIPTSRRGSGII